MLLGKATHTQAHTERDFRHTSINVLRQEPRKGVQSLFPSYSYRGSLSAPYRLICGAAQLSLVEPRVSDGSRVSRSLGQQLPRLAPSPKFCTFVLLQAGGGRRTEFCDPAANAELGSLRGKTSFLFDLGSRRSLGRGWESVSLEVKLLGRGNLGGQKIVVWFWKLSWWFMALGKQFLFQKHFCTNEWIRAQSYRLWLLLWVWGP